ncbi:acyltransferase family protein [Xanthobacter aminoxidans]|uniref:acyltransferase family protein n=1 Tax=Xanthobacter aminoxidans TaxID=186280 RepID=UPI003726FA9A
MSLAYRSDIDGLRAIAVGSVVLFHARIPPFTGGYIGVDVFFVISGFLITSILHQEMTAGTYSLVDFYDRRIRRIFPALFLMMAATTLFAAFILMPRQMQGYAGTLVPSALFFANIHFESLLNYFGPAADEVPLLHLWSLAVEEQFYIFFPIILFVLMKLGGRRLAVGGLALIAAGSLAYAQSIVASEQSAAFFLLQGRAWELLAGSLLAMVTLPRLPERAASWLGIAGALAIVVPVFVFGKETLFPGLWALPPVLGAVAIILSGGFAPNGVVARVLSLKGMVYVGRISYALYLWHWPILVLFAIWKGRHSTYIESGILVLAAGIISALSLKYVETPVRRGSTLGGRRLARIGAGACAILLAVGVALVLQMVGRGVFPISPLGAAGEAAADDRSTPQRKCNNNARFWTPDQMKPIAECALGPDAAKGTYDVLVWGDSHAGATFIGLAQIVEKLGLTARLQTMAACPPLIGGVALQQRNNGRVCARYVAAVMDEIRRVKPKVVVLVGRWSLWTTLSGPLFLLVSDEVPGGMTRSRANSERVFAHMMERTVIELRELGTQVVVLGQSPELRPPAGKCVAIREFNGVGGAETCLSQPRTKALDVIGPASEVIAATASRHPGVSLFRMADIFCRDDRCIAGEGMRFFYVDGDHLSATGARLAGEDKGLRRTLIQALVASGARISAAND